MNHEERRAKGRTHNDCKSLADQSQADDTNINVILKKYGVTGTATGKAGPPQYLDHGLIPRDLRDAIDLTKTAEVLRNALPEQLRSKPLDELTNLTMEQLNTMLQPPAKEPETKEGEK